jgi:hypothetical protein
MHARAGCAGHGFVRLGLGLAWILRDPALHIQAGVRTAKNESNRHSLPLKPVRGCDLDPAQTLFRLTFTAESDARQFCYVPNAVVVTLIRGKVSLIGYGAGKTKWRWVTMTNRASDTAMTLDTIVARLNIERYRKKLSAETDATTRRTLLHLVAEEKAKLYALLSAAPAMEE